MSLGKTDNVHAVPQRNYRKLDGVPDDSLLILLEEAREELDLVYPEFQLAARNRNGYTDVARECRRRGLL